MSRIEDELRVALRPEEPAPDFTNRVMARISALPLEREEEQSKKQPGWRERLAEFFQPVRIKWAVAGAMLSLLMIATIGTYRHYERQRMTAELAEGERAKEQVMLAMKIASAKLNVAQRKVQDNAEK